MSQKNQIAPADASLKLREKLAQNILAARAAREAVTPVAAIGHWPQSAPLVRQAEEALAAAEKELADAVEARATFFSKALRAGEDARLPPSVVAEQTALNDAHDFLLAAKRYVAEQIEQLPELRSEAEFRESEAKHAAAAVLTHETKEYFSQTAAEVRNLLAALLEKGPELLWLSDLARSQARFDDTVLASLGAVYEDAYVSETIKKLREIPERWFTENKQLFTKQTEPAVRWNDVLECLAVDPLALAYPAKL